MTEQYTHYKGPSIPPYITIGGLFVVGDEAGGVLGLDAEQMKELILADDQARPLLLADWRRDYALRWASP